MKVLKCNCKHAFQDAKLGENMRWHNISKPNSEDPKPRCTVCGNEKDRDSKKKQLTLCDTASYE